MRLVSVFGVDLRMNVLFMLMMVVFWYFGFLFQALVIFSVVFLHEMGHVVVAKGYGMRVTEIELLPFGGVARMEGHLELDPVTETYVALAGPLTNGFLLLLGWILGLAGFGNQQWLTFFMECNLMLGLFNLIPAFPLDGGRVLRAFLALRIGLKKATERASGLSRIVGFGMLAAGAVSLFLNEGEYINFAVIAGFLIYASAKEKGNVMYLFMKFLARKKEDLFREGVLICRQVVALETSRLKDVVKFFVPKKYHLVVVVGRDQTVRGTLTEGEVIDQMLGQGPETLVGSLLMRKK